MKRVDHPGSPGAESVSVLTELSQPNDDAADGEPGDSDAPTRWGEGGQVIAIPTQPATPPKLDVRTMRQVTRRGTERQRHKRGRRAQAESGRSVGAMPMTGVPRDVAWEATLRAVAHKQHKRTRPGGLAFEVEIAELLRRRHIRAPDHLLLLVVDASGSMAGELTATARSLAEHALRNAYVQRQRVAMIAFRAHGAELLFRPTTRVERARKAMDQLPLGGATPLGRGLDLAHKTLRRAAINTNYGHTTVLVISDGDANVGNRQGYGSAFIDVEQASRKLIAVPNTEIILLDTTTAGKSDQPARWLAEQLRARHVKLA